MHTLNGRIPICQPSGIGKFTVKEESLTTWVQYVTVGGLLLRQRTGRSRSSVKQPEGTANSQVHFVLNGLPTGVTVYWPTSVASTEDIDPVAAGLQSVHISQLAFTDRHR